MCGISGLVYKSKSKRDIVTELQTMMASLSHRGADGEGYCAITNESLIVNHNDSAIRIKAHQHPDYDIAIGHNRLALLDLSEDGAQPMFNENETVGIVFNGEIYNYLELKKQLVSFGYQFTSQTDTEVIIYAYQHWGMECIHRFIGMWAFALIDLDKEMLWICRDRFGIKPIYYHNNAKCFAFASEPKALYTVPEAYFTLNQSAIAQFLGNESLEEDINGLLNEIHELKPFNYLIYNLINHSITVKNYNDKQAFIPDKRALNQLLEESVAFRLRSDVPACALLSGGLDSSAIVAFMRKLNPDQTISTYTARFLGTDADESSWASLVAAHLKTKQQWVDIEADAFFNAIQKIVWHNDMPLLHTSTFAQYQLFKTIKSHGFKLVLDGQGGDELFAGYWRYVPFAFNELKAKHGFISSIVFITGLKGIPISFKFKTILKWVNPRKYADIKKNKINSLLSILNIEYENAFLRQTTDKLSLNEVLLNDFIGNDLKNLVRWADRMAMAHGVEARFPFADHLPLIAHQLNKPIEEKYAKGFLKYELRKAVQNILPLAVVTRKDKKGFTSPLTEWMNLGQSIWVPYLKQTNHPIFNKTLLVQKLDNTQFPLDYAEAAFWLRTYTLALWLETLPEQRTSFKD